MAFPVLKTKRDSRYEEGNEEIRKIRKLSEHDTHLQFEDRFEVELEPIHIENFLPGLGSQDQQESTSKQTTGDEIKLQKPKVAKRRRGRPSIRQPGELNPEKFNKFWLKAFRKYALRSISLRRISRKEKKFWRWFYSVKGIPETGYEFGSYSFKYVKRLFSNESYYRQFKTFFDKCSNSTLYSRPYLRNDPEKLQKYKEYGYSKLYCYHQPMNIKQGSFDLLSTDISNIQPLSPSIVEHDEFEPIDILAMYRNNSAFEDKEDLEKETNPTNSDQDRPEFGLGFDFELLDIQDILK